MLLTLAFCGMTAEAASPCTQAGLPARNLVTHSQHIDADTPGIRLYLRNKRQKRAAGFTADRTLLFVHGATYPAETVFDLPLGGFSWMDYMACLGYDVYLVDVRGYGRSTRPPEMSEPAASNRPIVRTETAVRDVMSAVAHILRQQGLGSLNLMGWSWGTATMANVAARYPDQVHKLVLYAPLWLRPEPMPDGVVDELGSYRVVTRQAARARWLAGVPPDKQQALIPRGWFEQWAAATWATDPLAARSGELRAPNGVIQDGVEYWSSGRAFYDPARIVAPALLVVGEWDRETPPDRARGLLSALTNSPGKRMVVIPEATHTVIMERNRMLLFRAVQAFLDRD